MKTCTVIYNPLSGKKLKYEFLPKFKKILEDHGYETEIIHTEYKGHTIEIIKNLPHKDLVISIGGDGTFNESVTGNYARQDKLILAHMPVGTTNDIGKMFGYGKNIIENLKITLSGTIKNVDICLINNKPFIYVACLGKFAEVPYETPRELKKKLGYFAYIKEGAKSLFQKTSLNEVTYEINGEKYHGLFSFMIISSANRIAGINKFYKDVKLDDDRFEVLLCNINKKKDIIKSFYFLTMHDATKVPGIYTYKTNNIKIKLKNKPRKNWCIDGEELKDDKLTFDIKIYNKMQMMVPNKNIKELFTK